ncbi:MAG: WYL domain-containing protein [Planctomycetota bacterium]
MNLSLETVLRCLDLVPIVRENPGITLAELSRRTGFAEKVIVEQLIPTLMLCGAPPYMPHDYISIWLEGDEVHCSFADHFSRPVTLLPIEITALHVALSSADIPGGRDAKAEARIARLREKIERALPEEQRIFLQESARVSVDDNLERGSPLLVALQNCRADRRKAEIDYLSGGESRIGTRVIHPYGVIVLNGVTYVAAFDEKRGHRVIFRLDRIGDVRPLDATFEMDPNYSLEEDARRGVFRGDGRDDIVVKVRARGEAARRIAESLDQRQWSWDKGGDALTLELPTSRPRAVVRFVLSLGPEAEILEPESVRAVARDEIAALRANFASS